MLTELKNEWKKAIEEELKSYLKCDSIPALAIGVPPKSEMGDAAFPLFPYAKAAGKAPPRMKSPIYIVSEPLGSTCTIVYEQFKKWGEEIDPLTAKVLLAGLSSDTVMLKSPTTTSYDVHVAKRLVEIGKVEDYGVFCRSIFSDGLSLAAQDPESVITSDMKTYHEKNVRFAIGQVEVTTLEEVRDIRESYLEALERVRLENALDWCMLLITDVINESSVLLTTPFEKLKDLVYDKITTGVYSLTGVLSRKKQLLPEILRVLEE